MATTKATKATEATEAPASVAVKRPTTCGAWVTANADHPAAVGRDVTCKRLPRHAGECRVTRKAAPKAPKAPKAVEPKVASGKAPKAARRTKAQIRRDAKALVATLLDAGVLTPDQALAAVAAIA